MMSQPIVSKSLSNSWKILEEELGNDRLPEDASVLQRFLYDSIEFLAHFKNVGDEKPDVLENWFEVLRKLMPKLTDHLLTWDAPNLKLGTVLVYLNHLTYHLVETKMTFLEHFKFLAVSMFYLLSTYIHSGGNKDKPDLVPDVAHKTYSLVCAAGQRVQKSSAISHQVAKRCYELYFLGAACLNLDRTNRSRNGIKTATDFVSAYVDWCSRLKDSESDAQDTNFNTNLLCVAVRTYIAQPRDIHGDTSLAYFIELFKLSKWQPAIAEKLFACDGNLFKFELDYALLKFSDAPCQSLRAINYEESMKVQAPVNHEVNDLVMSLLRLSHIFVSSHIENEGSAAGLDDRLEKYSYYKEEVRILFSLLADSPKPLQPVMANAVLMVIKVLPQTDSARNLLLPNTLRLCYHLSSLAVRVMVRELLKVAGQPEKEAKVQSKVYELAFTCKIRLAFLQQFVAKKYFDMEEMRAIAVYLKPCLTALTHLISQVDKKSLIDQQSNLYKQLQKCFECAVFNIGSIGRNLRRHEEYEITIALLSQLWPVAKVPALIALVTYQESLAISYKQMGQTDKALAVIRECAVLDPSLMTDVLVRTLVKIAEQKPNFNFLSFFKPLEKDPVSHREALQRTLKELLTGHQSASAVAHAQALIEKLCVDEDISPDQKAIYKLYLAELMWASEDKAANTTSERCSGKAYSVACEANLLLAADESGNLDDYLCQAVFLVWEMKHRLACMQVIAKLKPHWERKSHSRHQTTTATPSEPTSTATPTEPPEPGSQPHQPLLKADSTPHIVSDTSPGVQGPACGEGKEDSGIGSGGQSSAEAELNLFLEDSDVLMYKAKECLTVWIAWFRSRLQDKNELDSFRVDRSLRFLTKVADLALLCHQVKPAVESLCYARKLASLYSKDDTVKRLTGTLVYCLAKFGQPLSVPPLPREQRLGKHSKPKTARGCRGKDEAAYPVDEACSDDDNTPGKERDSEGAALSAEDVWFLEQIGLGADCHVLNLASLAYHYFQTGQVSKFLNLQTCILSGVESMRAKGPLTPNCTLTLGIIHRLTAQFYSSPASQHYREETIARNRGQDYALEPYPLESVSDSLKYIMSVAAFYLGDNFKDAKRGVCPETWRVLHEYLTTLKLQGELYVHCGNMKYARTHFYEGLRVSMSSLLCNWTTIFLSRITEVGQLCCDVDQSVYILHSAAVIYASQCRRKFLRQIDLCGNKLCPCVKQPDDFWTLENIAIYHRDSCHSEHSGWRSDSPCCWCEDEDVAQVRQRLTQRSKDVLRAGDFNHRKLVYMLLARSSAIFLQVNNGFFQPLEILEGEAGAEERRLNKLLSKIEMKVLLAEVAPLLLDYECCNFCYQPEMTEARARLLCSYGEIRHQESKGQDMFAAQSFHYAFCAASGSLHQSSRLEQMINSTLSEAQLPHLLVRTSEYIDKQKKVLELSMISRLNCLISSDTADFALSFFHSIHKEAKVLQGDANSHLLEASAALNLAHLHHKAARTTLVQPDMSGDETAQQKATEVCVYKALFKALGSWFKTLSLNNVELTAEEIEEWGKEFDKFKLAQGAFAASNPLIQELLTSVGKLVHIAGFHYAFQRGFDSDFVSDLLDRDNSSQSLQNKPVDLLPEPKSSELSTAIIGGKSHRKDKAKGKTQAQNTSTGSRVNLKQSQENAGPAFSFSPLTRRLNVLNLRSSVNPYNIMMTISQLCWARTGQVRSRPGLDADSKILSIARKRHLNPTRVPVEGTPNKFPLSNRLNKTDAILKSMQNCKKLLGKADKEAKENKISTDNTPISLGPKLKENVLKDDMLKINARKSRQQKTVSNKCPAAHSRQRQKLEMSTTLNEIQQSVENQEKTGQTERLLIFDTKLSHLSKGESDPCRQTKPTHRKTQSRLGKQRVKNKTSPESARGEDNSRHGFALSPHLLLNANILSHRLAPSPDIDNSPRYTTQCINDSSPSSKLYEPKVDRTPESCSPLSTSETNLETFNSFIRGDSWRNSPNGLLSPVELPRGRPQRATKAKARPKVLSREEEDEQSTEASSPQKCKKLGEDLAEKENVIQCTPEREIGKSPFPLFTPKSKKKSELTSNDPKDECSQRDAKKAVLNSRKIADENLQMKSPEPPVASDSKAKRTRRLAMKSKENIQPTQSEISQQRKTRASRRAGNRPASPCSSAGEDQSLTTSEDNQMETSVRACTKSPSKRHSEADMEALLTIPDKTPLKQASLRGKRKTRLKGGVEAKEETIGYRGNPRDCEESLDKLLGKELRDIENDDFIVEPDAAGPALPSVSSGAKHEVDVDETNEPSPFTILKNDLHKTDGFKKTWPDPNTESECEDRPSSKQHYEAFLGLFSTLRFSDSNLVFSELYATKLQRLSEALQLMDHLPASVLYGQLCRAVAMLTWEISLLQERQSMENQVKIAAYLTASMHVTFQHMLTRNLRTKLRKTQDKPSRSDMRQTESAPNKPERDAETASDEEWIGEDQLQEERQRMTTALKHVAFRGVDVGAFKDDLKDLPPDYTVVQVSVIDLDPSRPEDGMSQVLVTRLSRDLAPLTVGIPLHKMKLFGAALKLFDKVVLMQNTNCPYQYWSKRFQADNELRALTNYFQLCFLGAHIYLMKGRVKALVDEEQLRETLVDFAANLVELVSQTFDGYYVDQNIVLALLDCLLLANSAEMEELMSCMWPGNIAQFLAAQFSDFQTQLVRLIPGLESTETPETSWGLLRGPVVLILDKTLARLPWESMTDLLDQTVTRVPSLASLKVLLTMHSEKVAVNPNDAVAVVDPEQNLRSSADFLLPIFKKIRGWTCLGQKPPTVSDLKAILTEHSLYLYCGHGWGKQFVGGEDLQSFRGKALAVIMGCYSNKLEYKPSVDGDGAPLYFLMAGCPAVMGNLWIVTDKDIDKMTLAMVHQWFSKTFPSALSASLAVARHGCKLMGLNGFAPVIYGLPVHMVGDAADRKPSSGNQPNSN